MNELLRYLELLIELKNTNNPTAGMDRDLINCRINKVCDQAETVLLVDLKPDNDKKEVTVHVCGGISNEEFDNRIRHAMYKEHILRKKR